ncbi:MAG TPA: hypothetical protein VGQ75_09595 [Thermoanaerobaculia bacterium]|nr:hypothetical protein [Thermoanaerobaculia bacterium]HEV8609120.1 hypothetical protein [Thermoanaerobaculia bacterium]
MRIPFGTDRLEPGPDGNIVLRCAASKGWRPRSSGAAAARRAEHPGTAVAWGEEILEVVAAEPLPDGGMRYSLVPWRDEVAIRSLERYDAASESALAAERRWRADARRKRRLAILLSPLLGHLPGAVQESMEQEFGAPANAMTMASALPLLAIGIVGLFAQFARVAGGSLAPLPEPSLPLSIYLFGESALRLTVVATQSRPAGSIPGSLLYELWRRARS